MFDKPTPFWAEAFVGAYGMIIPKHVFEPYIGAKSREAPANLAPIGTGAYKFKEFHPGDMVSGVINADYHEPNRPFFDAVEMKGGGDAVSAARAVLQTGEYDYSWNLQVEDSVLKQLEEGGKGHVQLSLRREHRAYPAQHHRSQQGGGRRALQHQDHAPDARAIRRCARRWGCWWTARRCRNTSMAGPRGDRELRQRPEAVRVEGYQLGIQRRQGDRVARQGRLEAGTRRHPREGRQAS